MLRIRGLFDQWRPIDNTVQGFPPLISSEALDMTAKNPPLKNEVCWLNRSVGQECIPAIFDLCYCENAIIPRFPKSIVRLVEHGISMLNPRKVYL